MTAKGKRSTRRSPKPKLLLDEGLPPRQYFPKLNRYCDIKHIKQDFRLSGITDELVYKIACEEQRILVTFNIKDFKALIAKNGITIIGLSAVLTSKQIDTKLTSLIKKLKTGDWFGRFISVTGETRLR